MATYLLMPTVPRSQLPCSSCCQHENRRHLTPWSYCQRDRSSTSNLDQLVAELDLLQNLFPWKFQSSKKSTKSNQTSKKATDQSQNVASTSQEELSSHDKEKSDKFNISLKIGDAFRPEEINVKIIGKRLQIECKHEEKDSEDGDFVVVRQFTRSYIFSDDVDIENFTSSLSLEGVLSVEAPRLQNNEVEQGERSIPIAVQEKPVAPQVEITAENDDSMECETEKQTDEDESK